MDYRQHRCVPQPYLPCPGAKLVSLCLIPASGPSLASARFGSARDSDRQAAAETRDPP